MRNFFFFRFVTFLYILSSYGNLQFSTSEKYYWTITDLKGGSSDSFLSKPGPESNTKNLMKYRLFCCNQLGASLEYDFGKLISTLQSNWLRENLRHFVSFVHPAPGSTEINIYLHSYNWFGKKGISF